MTLFMLERRKKKKKTLLFVGLVKGYIPKTNLKKKKTFLINSLIHLKLNSLTRQTLYYKLLLLIYDFMNILENKLYIIFPSK